MYELKLDRRPLHIQAQQHLLKLIEDGAYQPGQQLPSESNLAAQLGISRPTLREALFNLEQEGLIVRKHGVGTFVAPAYGDRLASGLERLESILALADRQGMSTQVLRLTVERIPADDRLAERLELTPSTPLTRVRRTIAVDGRSAAYLVDFIPAAVLPPEALKHSFDGSVLDLLVRRNGIRIHEALAEITAINADALLAEHLEVDPGHAVLLLSETLFTEEHAPIEFSRNYFLPDFFDFHILRR
ncbi:MAG: GntR family transcriptional regulator [Anaerolineae bacterium]|jgi:GntR family transcriptional regulator